MPERERVAGYVVDIACLRKYPSDELVDKARAHTRECLLMGHCIDSGYGLVTPEGEVTLLNTGATAEVVAAVKASRRESGLSLVVDRTCCDGEMAIRSVTETEATPSGSERSS